MNVFTKEMCGAGHTTGIAGQKIYPGFLLRYGFDGRIYVHDEAHAHSLGMVSLEHDDDIEKPYDVGSIVKFKISRKGDQALMFVSGSVQLGSTLVSVGDGTLKVADPKSLNPVAVSLDTLRVGSRPHPKLHAGVRLNVIMA
jgi:hypothetical protein